MPFDTLVPDAKTTQLVGFVQPNNQATISLVDNDGEMRMGKFFGVAILESGFRGTVWFDEAPAIGSEVTIWHYDLIGTLVSKTGKLKELK